MQRLKRLLPVARATAVIGAVMGLVTAVSFAALQSNTVALTPNNITTASATLLIDAGTACANNSPTTTPGFSVTNLAPGASASVNFCLRNTGGVPLNITGSIPQDLSSSVAAQNTQLSIDCGLGNLLVANLNSWGPGTFANPIPADTNANCTATVTLSPSYSGSGGEAIPAFSVNFVGTQPAT